MRKKLYRMRYGKVCGVCAGIAAYFNWNPTKVRIAYVGIFLLIASGSSPHTSISFAIFLGLINSLIWYLILTFFIPLYPIDTDDKEEGTNNSQ